jgi:type IV pilus assembly protein PilX
MTLRRSLFSPARQRGVVLFIALIVMVAMSLAAIALMRSVDTTSQVIANLAFRQASILPANLAIEDAASGLFVDAGGPRIMNTWADDSTQNYYAKHDQTWDSKNKPSVPDGVPQPLWTKTSALGLGRQLPQDGSGNTVTYIIERMCNPDVAAPGNDGTGKASEGWCDLGTPKGGGKHTINEAAAFNFPPQPFYRVTVRVDGPQNTVSFLQAMLR